jgi:hypothetical protein
VKSLLEILGYRRRRYSGDGFSIHIRSLSREGICIAYNRGGLRLDMVGEQTGRSKGIGLSIPQNVDEVSAKQIVTDLEVGFKAMKYEYDIEQGLKLLARSAGYIPMLERIRRRKAKD